MKPATESSQSIEARARVIKALAHPSRILIAEALSERERCVQELTNIVGSDMSTVSRHLSIMKNAGLVVARRDGAKQFYRICCECLSDFFGCVDQISGQPPSS